jgi:hypothetical protein
MIILLAILIPAVLIGYCLWSAGRDWDEWLQTWLESEDHNDAAN